MAVRYIFDPDKVVAFKNASQADPQAIGEELDKIAAQNGGEIVPEKVVEAARNRRSPLHKHFEWSDEEAASRYRIDQARSLVRSIHREDVPDTERPTRSWLSIKDKNGVSYRNIDDVLSSADIQSRVLANAERDLLAFESRYRDLTEICGMIRAARERIVDRRSKQESGDRASA